MQAELGIPSCLCRSRSVVSLGFSAAQKRAGFSLVAPRGHLPGYLMAEGFVTELGF